MGLKLDLETTLAKFTHAHLPIVSTDTHTHTHIHTGGRGSPTWEKFPHLTFFFLEDVPYTSLLYFVASHPCRCFCWRLLMVNYSLSWMSSFLVVVLCLTMEMLEMLDHQKWEEVWLWHAGDQYKNSFSLPLKYLSRRILISPTWDSNHPISGEYKGFALKESNEEKKDIEENLR